MEKKQVREGGRALTAVKEKTEVQRNPLCWQGDEFGRLGDSSPS